MTDSVSVTFYEEVAINGDELYIADLVERTLSGLPPEVPIVVVSQSMAGLSVEVKVYRNWTESHPRSRVLAGIVRRLIRRTW